MQIFSASSGAFSTTTQVLRLSTLTTVGPSTGHPTLPLSLSVAYLSASFLPLPWYPTSTVLTFSKQTNLLSPSHMQTLGIQDNKRWHARASWGAHGPSDDHTDKCPVTNNDKGNVQGAQTAEQLQERRRLLEEATLELKAKG